MSTTLLHAPPPGFSDPRTVLHTTTLLILPYNHRHNRKIMRRVAVGRASASKELCCASRSIRFACNDHRRGHSKTILIGFFTFFDQLLPPNLYVNIFKGGYTSKKKFICFLFPNEGKIVCTQTICRIVFKCMKMASK